MSDNGPAPTANAVLDHVVRGLVDEPDAVRIDTEQRRPPARSSRCTSRRASWAGSSAAAAAPRRASAPSSAPPPAATASRSTSTSSTRLRRRAPLRFARLRLASLGNASGVTDLPAGGRAGHEGPRVEGGGRRRPRQRLPRGAPGPGQPAVDRRAGARRAVVAALPAALAGAVRGGPRPDRGGTAGRADPERRAARGSGGALGAPADRVPGGRAGLRSRAGARRRRRRPTRLTSCWSWTRARWCPIVFVQSCEDGVTLITRPRACSTSSPRSGTVRIDVFTIFPALVDGFCRGEPAGPGPADRACSTCAATTCATTPPTSTARSTTPPSAAGPGWCCGPSRSSPPSRPSHPPRPLYLLGPGGRRFDQALARTLAGGDGLQPAVRPLRGRRPPASASTWSTASCRIGDYVLAGGEVAVRTSTADAGIQLFGNHIRIGAVRGEIFGGQYQTDAPPARRSSAMRLASLRLGLAYDRNTSAMRTLRQFS